MPTTNAGAFNIQRIGVTVQPDNSMSVVLDFTNASTNAQVVTRIITIPANSANPITDQLGNVIAAGGTYSGLATAISSFLSNLDTAISNAATGNKLNL